MEKNEILMEILRWERIQGLMVVRELVPKLMESPIQKKIYQLTNGKNGAQDIAKKLRVSNTTVSNNWKIWHTYCLLEKVGRKYKKCFSLKELGLM